MRSLATISGMAWSRSSETTNGVPELSASRRAALTRRVSSLTCCWPSIESTRTGSRRSRTVPFSTRSASFTRMASTTPPSTDCTGWVPEGATALPVPLTTSSMGAMPAQTRRAIRVTAMA